MEDVTEGTLPVEAYVQLLVIAQLVVLFFVIAVLFISEWALFFGVARWRRGFRCPLMKREVEVEFEGRRVLGVRWPVAVKSCTAFESPEAIECRRACVDRAFRRQWESALPVHGRRMARST